jgi:hypothetical protein
MVDLPNKSKKTDPAVSATGSGKYLQLSSFRWLELQQCVHPDVVPAVVVGNTGTASGLASVEVGQVPIDPRTHSQNEEVGYVIIDPETEALEVQTRIHRVIE